MPFWALTVLFLWKGFKDNKTTDWLLMGLFGGLGFMSKYLFIYLGLAIDLFIIYMVYKNKFNFNFKTLISIIPFCIVLLPHLIWLTENNYITITYGLNRTGMEEPNILNHIKYPLIFLGKQIGILIPFFIMVLFLIKNFKSKIKDQLSIYHTSSLNFSSQLILFLPFT